MRLTTDPLAELATRLGLKSASITNGWGAFGQPTLIEKASSDAEAVFSEFSKARPSPRDGYAAALAFLNGDTLSERQRELLASALNQQVLEHDRATPLGSPRLLDLLRQYQQDIDRKQLWRLTWYGLLVSYFSMDSMNASATHIAGWEHLRSFLDATLPSISEQNQAKVVPPWLATLRDYSILLTHLSTRSFAPSYLRGNDTLLSKISVDIGIPENSWFWQRLVISAVRAATDLGHAEFSEHIPRLLTLIKQRPAFRDDAIEAILIRYHQIPNRPLQEDLRDYVVHKDVWRNPKLKTAGIAPSWNRVPDEVWLMVRQWANERTLRDFFDILAARNHADDDRLKFWIQYLDQIATTKLIFSNDTMALARTNTGIGQLIAIEAGTSARLNGYKNLDAFIMEIDRFVIVEFSMKPNAAYVYELGKLPFDRAATSYHGGAEDLRNQQSDGLVFRIIHTPGWERRAASDLARIGIVPDRKDLNILPWSGRSAASPSALTQTGGNNEADAAEQRYENIKISSHGDWRAPKAKGMEIKSAGVRVSMYQLKQTLAEYPAAYIDDKRSKSGGRLWVEDPEQNVNLGQILKAWKFRWSNSRSAWYLED